LDSSLLSRPRLFKQKGTVILKTSFRLTSPKLLFSQAEVFQTALPLQQHQQSKPPCPLLFLGPFSLLPPPQEERPTI